MAAAAVAGGAKEFEVSGVWKWGMEAAYSSAAAAVADAAAAVAWRLERGEPRYLPSLVEQEAPIGFVNTVVVIEPLHQEAQ